MENKKQVFTREEVIELLYQERKRAVDICYQSRKINMSSNYEGFSDTYRLCKIAEAEEARLLGNQISGMTGLDTDTPEMVMRKLISRNLK